MSEPRWRVTHVRPERWTVCFYETSTSKIARAVPGRYKHVACFGFIPGQRLWVFYSWGFGQSIVQVAPDYAADPFIEHFVVNALQVDFVTPMTTRCFTWNIFGLCVPHVAQLIGASSRALRPDRFLADLLRQGGKVIGDFGRERTAPGATEPAGAGEGPSRPAGADA